MNFVNTVPLNARRSRAQCRAVTLLAAAGLALGAACGNDLAAPRETAGSPPTPGVTATGVTGGVATPRATGTQAAVLDPCTLLTRAEAEAANGPGLGAGERGRGASFNQCTFAEQATGRLVSVSIDQGSQTRDEFTVLRRMFSQSGEAVAGVGDQAFIAARTLWALTGDALLSVQVVGAVTGPELRTRLIGLMTKALDRI